MDVFALDSVIWRQAHIVNCKLLEFDLRNISSIFLRECL